MKTFIFFISLLLLTAGYFPARGQWKKLQVPGAVTHNGLIAAPDNQTIYFFMTDSSYDYRLMKSTDKGRSWTSTFHMAIGFFPVLNVQFINRDTGIIVTGRDVFVTRNGGNTWDTVKTNSGDPFGYNLTDLHFGGTSLYAAYRQGDTLVKVDVSRNLGLSWQRVTAMPYSGWQEANISFTGNGNGYIYQTKYPAYILHTRNDGTAFDTIRSTSVNQERISYFRFSGDGTGIISRDYHSYINSSGTFPETLITAVPDDTIFVRRHIQTGTDIYAIAETNASLLHFHIPTGSWQTDTTWNDDDFLYHMAAMPDGNLLVSNRTGLYIKDKSGTVGIDPAATSSLNVIIYPNPAGSVLYIKHASNLSIDQYRIFDATGRLVTTSANTAAREINISHLQPGSYHLEIQTSDNKYASKTFIKL